MRSSQRVYKERKWIDDGAAGRNVFQSAKPLELQRALLDVVKRDVAPEDTAKKYGLL